VRDNKKDNRSSRANNVVNRSIRENKNSKAKANVTLSRDIESAYSGAGHMNALKKQHSAKIVVTRSSKERKNNTVARRRPEMKIKDVANVTLRRD